jgi:hypothetical protein
MMMRANGRPTNRKGDSEKSMTLDTPTPSATVESRSPLTMARRISVAEGE